mmetsp:Transcript_11774/g.32233  ORF Transcript_11774/g.32233 Transcript_11774/m.32233 type:complete len:328 (+) Transcript_11774:505-1488(+)
MLCDSFFPRYAPQRPQQQLNLAPAGAKMHQGLAELDPHLFGPRGLTEHDLLDGDAPPCQRGVLQHGVLRNTGVQDAPILELDLGRVLLSFRAGGKRALKLQLLRSARVSPSRRWSDKPRHHTGTVSHGLHLPRGRLWKEAQADLQHVAVGDEHAVSPGVPRTAEVGQEALRVPPARSPHRLWPTWSCSEGANRAQAGAERAILRGPQGERPLQLVPGAPGRHRLRRVPEDLRAVDLPNLQVQQHHGAKLVCQDEGRLHAPQVRGGHHDLEVAGLPQGAATGLGLLHACLRDRRIPGEGVVVLGAVPSRIPGSVCSLPVADHRYNAER